MPSSTCEVPNLNESKILYGLTLKNLYEVPNLVSNPNFGKTLVGDFYFSSTCLLLTATLDFSSRSNDAINGYF